MTEWDLNIKNFCVGFFSLKNSNVTEFGVCQIYKSVLSNGCIWLYSEGTI